MTSSGTEKHMATENLEAFPRQHLSPEVAQPLPLPWFLPQLSELLNLHLPPPTALLIPHLKHSSKLNSTVRKQRDQSRKWDLAQQINGTKNKNRDLLRSERDP